MNISYNVALRVMNSFSFCMSEDIFILPLFFKDNFLGWGGAWVAQLVKHPTLDFGSGHDLRVVRLSPV